MSWRQLCRQFRKTRAAEISLYLIVVFIVTAVLAEAFSPYDPFTLGDDTLLGPSAGHWMGTDDLGRDTLSRVIYGARVPLLVGFLATATSMLLGILIGSFSGYFGGRTDVILMRATEYVLVVPRFFLALLVVAMLGTGVMKIVLVIGLLGWPEVARVVRGRVYISRAGDSLGSRTELSGFGRFQSDQLGITSERGSGTHRRIRLAGGFSRHGAVVARTLRQSFRRRY
ncbi:MAG: ABC transporter permease [Deltaproteobacteria bacterium]|nr:MAG: ABC transporter permease [Deltaproteobacteria bacterium]